ncbi:metallohydrolase [Caenimonas sedimenti]|uniref:Metallohydrolase n=1 Tax=Caenimonas sedimenti TaxID=2596921 RepID=A0A562ZIC9_9BURK|nr:metallohydrolase [Caenimonas sedimenti]TWO68065.1 metallohydrolase [Caenimonas sedimenti]
MPAMITFFPVGCGDMTLVELADADRTKILIDINIRQGEDCRDVAKDLRGLLEKDGKGRPFVHAFLMTHPDSDHIRGLETHFHLGAPADYPDDEKPEGEKRIFMREIWSSPLVYRRASAEHPLCSDAKAFNCEAKRRVQVNRDKKFVGVEEGDRILIMGADENGKTDDLSSILVKVDQTFTQVNKVNKAGYFTARLLAPLPKQATEDEEEKLRKNHSSVILNMQVGADAKTPDGCKFMVGGDAEVLIWQRLWGKHKNSKSVLEYDLLLAPHHCSWHSLSEDSWSKLREKAKVDPDARAALSVTRQGAVVVASSKPIKDDDKDPPCIRAKREYEAIVKDVNGAFHCVGEIPNEKNPEPLTFNVTGEGVQIAAKQDAPRRVAAVAASTTVPRGHG